MKKMYVLGTVKDACECANRFHAKNLVIWHTEDETTFGIRKEVYTKEAKTFFWRKHLCAGRFRNNRTSVINCMRSVFIDHTGFIVREKIVNNYGR